MTDKKKWGTTKNFQLPYPTTDTPVHDTPQVLRELASMIDGALATLRDRLGLLDRTVALHTDPAAPAQADAAVDLLDSDETVDVSKVAKALREAAGLPAITVEIDHEGQVTVKAPSLDTEEALRIVEDAIYAAREAEGVRRRLRGE